MPIRASKTNHVGLSGFLNVVSGQNDGRVTGRRDL